MVASQPLGDLPHLFLCECAPAVEDVLGGHGRDRQEAHVELAACSLDPLGRDEEGCGVPPDRQAVVEAGPAPGLLGDRVQAGNHDGVPPLAPGVREQDHELGRTVRPRVISGQAHAPAQQ